MPTIAEKWVQEGVDKEKINTTEKLINAGMDNAEIRKISGLSIKRISEIRHKLQNK